MAVDRAPDSDYDAWETLGNVGWGSAGLAPYFKKFSHFTPPSASSVKAFNITYDASAFGNGPVEISIPSYEYPDGKIQMDAYRAEPIAAPKEGFASPLGVYCKCLGRNLSLLIADYSIIFSRDYALCPKEPTSQF